MTKEYTYMSDISKCAVLWNNVFVKKVFTYEQVRLDTFRRWVCSAYFRVGFRQL